MISVVLPLWNKEQYIARTIQSILAQTFTKFEVIVVDDGSTDRSADIVRSFNDHRINLVSQANAGVSAARNRGIEEAHYPYIAFIDGDDEWQPDHLAVLAHLIETYPQCRAYSTCYQLQVNGRPATCADIARHHLPFRGEDGVMDNWYEVATGINAPANMSTLAVEKRLIQRIGGFPTGIRSGEDIVTLARLNIHTDYAYSLRHTAIIHLIYTGKNARPIEKKEPLDAMFDSLLYEAQGRKGVSEFVAFWHKQQMVRAIYQHKYALAAQHGLHSLRIRPLQYKVFVAAAMALYSVHSKTDLYSLQQKFKKRRK